MKTPQEKYRNDPLYRNFVDMIFNFIDKCQLTPSEVREAATLASINYEMKHFDRCYTLPSNVDDALQFINDFRDNKKHYKEQSG